MIKPKTKAVRNSLGTWCLYGVRLYGIVESIKNHGISQFV